MSIQLLEGFDDPSIGGAVWQRLLDLGQTNTVFLTRWWQKAWWKAFGRGQLLVLGVFRGKEPVGIAPLFADGGMVFFTGSGGSDYLDFIGGTPETPFLVDLLERVADLVPDFVGFRFYHVPEASPTGSAVQRAAEKGMLACYGEGSLPAPAIDLSAVGHEVTRKKSLLRHQRFFEREGNLAIRHYTLPEDILPRLESFFDQHVARWSVTPHPSLFLDPAQRRFYRELAESATDDSWLRFVEVSWDGRPIAFHFGFHYQGNYMWYKPSFDIDLAKRSPGEVLMRGLLLAALDEGASVFDLGLGSEAFKERFATHTRHVHNWGLYPSDSLSDDVAEERR